MFRWIRSEAGLGYFRFSSPSILCFMFGSDRPPDCIVVWVLQVGSKIYLASRPSLQIFSKGTIEIDECKVDCYAPSLASLWPVGRGNGAFRHHCIGETTLRYHCDMTKNTINPSRRCFPSYKSNQLIHDPLISKCIAQILGSALFLTGSNHSGQDITVPESNADNLKHDSLPPL